MGLHLFRFCKAVVVLVLPQFSFFQDVHAFFKDLEKSDACYTIEPDFRALTAQKAMAAFHGQIKFQVRLKLIVLLFNHSVGTKYHCFIV